MKNSKKKKETYNDFAERIYPTEGWIQGEGKFALLAHCRTLTVMLFDNEEEAEENNKFIDSLGCCGRCRRNHTIVDLDQI
jgi:hypothetical protein